MSSDFRYFTAFVSRLASGVYLNCGSAVLLPEVFLKAVALSPDLAEAYLNLGSLMSQQPERSQEARMQYRASLRIRPDYAEAHYNLGTALLDVPGRNLDAVSHLTAAVRLKPENVQVVY